MLNVSKRTAYMILAISIVIEIIGDAMLTASNGYEHRLLGIGAVITILFSFFLFSYMTAFRLFCAVTILSYRASGKGRISVSSPWAV